MPCDKLALLTFHLRRRYLRVIRQYPGHGAYDHVSPLRGTPWKDPVRLHCFGRRNGIHKLEFIGVAGLGLSQTLHFAEKFIGDLADTKIARIDWCLDVDVPFDEMVRSARLARVQNCSWIHSRGGSSAYLQNSKQKVVLIYQRSKFLRSRRDPWAIGRGHDEDLTRIEVQFRGRGVPVRKFLDIRKYGEMNLLRNMTFLQTKIRSKLTPVDRLTAEGIEARARQVGLQVVSKQFPAAQWASLEKRLFEPNSRSRFEDLQARFMKSVREWLNDVRRFPREDDLGPQRSQRTSPSLQASRATPQESGDE
jgi:hypothetical protein